MPQNFIILPSGASAWFGNYKRSLTQKLSNHQVMELIIAFLEHPKRLQMNLVSRICYVQYVPLAYTFYPHNIFKKQINAMLISLPNGSNKKAFERWMATNTLTFDIFKAFWQEVSPHLHFPGTKAGDDVTCTEWTEGIRTYQGMRKADGAKHGVIRSVYNNSYNGNIREATYFEDKRHGLTFTW